MERAVLILYHPPRLSYFRPQWAVIGETENKVHSKPPPNLWYLDWGPYQRNCGNLRRFHRISIENWHYQPSQTLKICSLSSSGSCNRYILATWQPNLSPNSSIVLCTHIHVTEVFHDGIVPHFPRNRYHPPAKNLKSRSEAISGDNARLFSIHLPK